MKDLCRNYKIAVNIANGRSWPLRVVLICYCQAAHPWFKCLHAARGWETDWTLWGCSRVGFFFFLYVYMQVSGLSVWIGRQLEPMSGLPPWAVTLLACLLVSAVTEFASNPATLTVFLPILSALVRHTHSLTHSVVVIFHEQWLRKIWHTG